jgi:hypothetical protein
MGYCHRSGARPGGLNPSLFHDRCRYIHACRLCKSIHHSYQDCHLSKNQLYVAILLIAIERDHVKFCAAYNLCDSSNPAVGCVYSFIFIRCSFYSFL